MRGFAFGAALVLTGIVATTFAQTPASPPQKPAPTAPAAQAPAPQPPPPAPFPEGAKAAFVVLQRIANESADGKAATAQIQALQQKKAAELAEKQKQLQGIQAKLEKEASVMSATAQADLAKQAEKLNTEIQRFTQDAQQELTELQEQLRLQFEARVQPVLDEVRQEKGLHFIFNGPDSGLVAADPGLDISLDVIKKLDAAKPAGAKPPLN
ncbi:MAG TPA: OmpH family outer membrane protein [Vicinamibacterales bacterium]|nr:OmpH family outer membrane protein [Vicinamibacterales bacterium]